MRPIDLTPEELRLGARPPMRTGPIPYIVVGGLVAVLVGIALLVTTSTQVSEAKQEVTSLKRQNVAAEREAQRLAAYVELRQLREARTETIASLADSRFDWERVMHELALILPHDVWLTSLNASASAGAGGGEGSEGGGGQLRSAIAGPALELTGCATGQEAVAGFVTTLKEIDGVTRVGLEHAELAEGAEGSTGGGGEGGGEECRTRVFISGFSLVVAFDAAPVPPAESAEALVPAPTESAEATASETESPEPTETTESSETTVE
jgi:Tfp pilus assembly protein PilN